MVSDAARLAATAVDMAPRRCRVQQPATGGNSRSAERQSHGRRHQGHGYAVEAAREQKNQNARR